ncbi:MAG: hypothetical protein ACRDC7_00910 [Aeromonas veronii]
MTSKFESVVGLQGPQVSFNRLLEGKKDGQPEITEKAFFESVGDDSIMESIDKAGNQAMRADAMAVVLAFVEDGDDSAEALDLYAQALADSDEDGEIGDPEQEDYELFLTLMAEALTALGVPAKIAMSAMEGDDAAASKAYTAASDFVEASEVDEDTLIAEFSVREAMIMEATKKVIRDGKVKVIKKPVHKKKMSSAQKQALKKAQRKAHTASAKKARAKSMKARRSRGM